MFPHCRIGKFQSYERSDQRRRLDPECGLVWQRCVPTEVQRLTWLAAAEFASAQLDAYVNPEEVGNPEGGWEDEDYMFEVSWEEEIWDDSGAY